MDSSSYFLVLLVVLCSQFQVVVAAGWEMGVGVTLGFVAFIGFAFFLRYYVYDKKCAPQEEERPKKQKVRKIAAEPQGPQFQVGHQPYQGEPQPQHNWQQPMPQGHPPPPMHGDPAYPPTVPAGGPAPANNPFKSASYGY